MTELIDFEAATHEELDQHAMEQLVFDGGAVSPVLRGHLFVEGVLQEILRRAFPKPDAILGKSSLTFDMKIDLAEGVSRLFH